jgi:ATP-dependent Clp protease ATP-binding subunit ClpC
MVEGYPDETSVVPGGRPEFGARLLRRTIQREIDNRLSGLLLAGKLGPGSQIMVDVHDGEFDIQNDSADETAAQPPGHRPI